MTPFGHQFTLHDEILIDIPVGTKVATADGRFVGHQFTQVQHSMNGAEIRTIAQLQEMLKGGFPKGKVADLRGISMGISMGGKVMPSLSGVSVGALPIHPSLRDSLAALTWGLKAKAKEDEWVSDPEEWDGPILPVE